MDPTDSISREYGTKDGYAYCGPRLFEISTLPNTSYATFIRFDLATNTFTYGSDLQSDIGIHSLEMRVFLVKYPNIERFKRFNVQIDLCQSDVLSQG